MTNIVITGGSSGIGEALALYYAKPGVALALMGRDTARLDAVARACRAKGAQVQTQIMDVTDRAGMAQFLTMFDSAHPIDLLLANAGIGGGGGLEPSAQGLEDARRMFAINIEGVLNTIDPILPRMAARGRGQVGLMSSLAGFCGMASAPGYAASKGFVKNYGEGLRGAFAKYGIAVSVICPGFVRSRLTAQNKFKMPFFMEADAAAAIIVQGLQKNKARIAFPWPLVAMVWLFSALPAAALDFVTRRFPKKV